MTKLRTASICLTDVLEAAKTGHSAFSRSDKNKKVYFNISIWDNEEKNKFDQDVSIQLRPEKDTPSERLYIGNGKKQEYIPLSATTNSTESPVVAQSEGDDLPF